MTNTTASVSLRPYRDEDAPILARGLNNLAVSSMTGAVPYPYTVEVAEGWIELNKWAIRRGIRYNFAIANENDELVGGIGIFPSRQANVMGDGPAWEVGYWIGEAHWGRGYASAALTLILDFLKSELEADRCDAGVFAGNLASQRVLSKAGFEAIDGGPATGYNLALNQRRPQNNYRLTGFGSAMTEVACMQVLPSTKVSG
jgi:[ribosomal protein S5]-alanine N-acetyltransferase